MQVLAMSHSHFCKLFQKQNFGFDTLFCVYDIQIDCFKSVAVKRKTGPWLSSNKGVASVLFSINIHNSLHKLDKIEATG